MEKTGRYKTIKPVEKIDYRSNVSDLLSTEN